MIPDGVPSISPLPSILRDAEIMASGFFVNSTDPASARISRERDSARRIISDSAHAAATISAAMAMAAIAPPLPSAFSLGRDEETDGHPKPRELISRRKNSSAKEATIAPSAPRGLRPFYLEGRHIVGALDLAFEVDRRHDEIMEKLLAPV